MKLFRVLIFVLAIDLIIASLASGMELSTSIGGNGGSSSMNVRYGATVDDYNYEHIQLNPEDSTLSNSFSGSGSLPSSSISTSDTNGNYASVSRSVSGKPVTTKWNYDWNTYKSTSSAGSGVGAWLSLTASNAYSIYGSGYASNREGDSASASTTIGSSGTTSSLSSYYVNPYAFTNEADAYQSANSASGNTIQNSEYANNYEGDSIVRWYDPNHPSDIENGKINSYVGSAKAQKYSVTDSVSIGSLSGNVLYKGLGARNKVGDNVIEGVRFPVVSSSNSITNYKATVYADSAKVTGTLNAGASGDAIMGGTSFYGSLYADSFINLLSGSLSGYSNSITSTSAQSKISQGLTSTSSGSSISTNSNAYNGEGDSSTTTTGITTGLLSGYSDTATTTSSSAKSTATASTISATGTSALHAIASSTLETDRSTFDMYVNNGKITAPYFYASSGTGISEQAYASIPSAYGTTAEIKSHAQNLALAYDSATGSSIPNGQADFKALKTNGAAFTNAVVNTQATLNLLGISSTGFSKTALLLEPFKWEFGDLYGPANSVGSTLENKGYAVTDYSNAGVTWDKVYKLDESTVSVINTHGWVPSNMGGDTYGLAISYDPSSTTLKSWVQLQPYLTTPNSMIIVSACDPFNTNAKTTTFTDGTKTYTPGKYTVSKAIVSGGFVGSVLIADTTPFLDTLFQKLATGTGSTLSAANIAAASSINNRQKLALQGSTVTSWKLP